MDSIDVPESGPCANVIACAFRVFERHQYEHHKIPGTRRRILVDAQTANAVVAVYRALSRKNQARYLEIATSDPAKACAMAWHLISTNKEA